MDHSLRSGLLVVGGIGLLGTAVAAYAILVDGAGIALALAAIGALLIAAGSWALRDELRLLFGKRRGEVVLATIGLVGAFVALAYLSNRLPVRFDMTTSKQFSLAAQTIEMLRRLDKPVRITFFHDPMMRESVELYQQMVRKADGKIALELIDPMLNPAQARLRGVEFAGTAILESEGRRLSINSPTETDIANGILRVSQGAQQVVCFLDGHGEADPFSLESHDHLEGDAGHSHGLGTKLVLHERHGMAKARQSLEAMNYSVEKLFLAGGRTGLSRCAVLVVAGPKTALLPDEVKAIDSFIEGGGNAMFMLDPFIETGLEPIVRKLGIVVEDTMVIDPASHFWTDVSAPAITDYNRHEITRDLPLTFFPGARSLSPTPQRVPSAAVRPLVNASRKSYGQTNRERVGFDPKNDRAGPVTVMAIVVRSPEFVKSAEAVLRELREAAPPPSTQPALATSNAATDEAPGEKAAGRKSSRIAVVGDSDFATNSFFHIMGNGRLFLNTVNFLAAQENLIGIQPRTHDLPRVNLTNVQMRGTFFLSIILVPALMAMVGLVVWWRQR